MPRCLLPTLLALAVLSQSGCALYLQRVNPLVEGQVVDADSGAELSGVTLTPQGGDPSPLSAGGGFRAQGPAWKLRLFYTVGGT